MSDIRLFNKTGNYEGVIIGEPEAEKMSSSMLSQSAATGLEVLANKVTKYMLTAKGTFSLFPEYGSRLTMYGQIRRQAIPRIHLELTEDVRACARYIQDHEDEGMPTTAKKLAYLKLERLHYDPVLTPFRLDVFIRVTSADGESALLDIRS